MAPKMKSQPRAYTVLYNSENHFSVLTQMHGSSWPRVFPYCVINCAIMLALTYFRSDGLDWLKISDQGHTFVTMVMSFLLVSRVTMALSRYSEARNHIGAMFRASRKSLCFFCGCISKSNRGQVVVCLRQTNTLCCFRPLLQEN